MKVVEHLLAQPGVLARLYAGRPRACFRLLRWLAETEKPVAQECPVSVASEEVAELMRPCGVNGGRIGR